MTGQMAQDQEPPTEGTPLDLACTAWTIIANAYEGDWNAARTEWREAAERWRDKFHAAIGGRGMVLPELPNGGEPAAPPVPEGEFARVEVTGYVQWHGWVTEDTLAGAPVLVVHDRAGKVLAKVPGTQLHQYVPLPPPADEPARLALTAGARGQDYWDGDDDEGSGPF